MSTIPSKPLGEFEAESTWPEKAVTHIHCREGHMNIMPPRFQNTIITKEQAMAFFDLVPKELLQESQRQHEEDLNNLHDQLG